MNILLHGAPGTGKTEFLQGAGKASQYRGYIPSARQDEDGDEPFAVRAPATAAPWPEAPQRSGQQPDPVLMRWKICFPGLDSGMFWFFPRGAPVQKVHSTDYWRTTQSRHCGQPTISAICDPAFLRRISFTLELRTPPFLCATASGRNWPSTTRCHKVPLPRELCLELAHSMEDAPALADSALRAARITRGGADDVKLAAAAISRAVRGGHTQLIVPSSIRFEPELTNADQDLALITERFVACGPANTGGLCLSGPPGTGKSAFARYLADRMQMPVLERRASDLLDRYVGGSERNIADAFAEARDTSAFLVFDEADSLLGARDGATHRWEISQVNEMLTWMENHPLPFACTTNLVDRLDPATARRFSLKVGFLPLNVQQREACFRRFFKTEPPLGLSALDQLTPGDFAVVAKRSKLLGINQSDALLAELRREQTAKPDTRNPIGFRVAS